MGKLTAKQVKQAKYDPKKPKLTDGGGHGSIGLLGRAGVVAPDIRPVRPGQPATRMGFELTRHAETILFGGCCMECHVDFLRRWEKVANLPLNWSS